jgi:hypothetical protein
MIKTWIVAIVEDEVGTLEDGWSALKIKIDGDGYLLH